MAQCFSKVIMRHLVSVLLLLGLLSTSSASAAEPKRPNILWLIAEDFGPEALSRAGTPQAATPNLDRLASEGVYYSRAYAGMVCSVSRSSFMTGMYATSIGAQNHRTTKKSALPSGVRILTEWMREAGYFTANLVTLPAACGFEGTGKMDWNFKIPSKPFDSSKWADLKAHQPFYAQINFQETHRMTAKRQFAAAPKADPAKVVLPPYYPDHPVARRDWAKYLDVAAELDRKIGRVLQQLETDGLADNTIVMFFGDNGATMVRAKQFPYEEGFHVPLIIRWPKNFPAPQQIKAGLVDDRLVDAIDFATTMLALAGAPKPPKMQGRVFLGDRAEPAREFVFGTRDRCDDTVMRIRSVRDARYRYLRNFTPEVPFLGPNNYKETHYPVWNLLKELHAAGKLTPAQELFCQPRMPEEELYDLQTDPHQIHNLATSPKSEHQAELKRMRAALAQWTAETGDK
jgi:N-sulfoglucosamine sulfohydrolase